MANLASGRLGAVLLGRITMPANDVFKSPVMPKSAQFFDRFVRWIPLLLIAAVLATFWPLMQGEFTQWDDLSTIAQNPWLNPPSLAHLAEFWNPGHPYMDIWIPLTYTVWSMVAAVSYVQTPDPDSGAHVNSWLFHGTNVAIHIVSVLLVFAILKRLTRRHWPAAFGALLFALHPVQVEPVGWISGLKDVLAGCLSLAAILHYLAFANESSRVPGHETPPVTRGTASSDMARNDRESRRRTTLHYLAATLFFVLAMLAKPAAVALPGVVAVLGIFLLGGSAKRVALALVPWFLLTIPIILIGRSAQPADFNVFRPAIEMRPLIAADALAFYIGKLLLPLRLGIMYDRSPQIVLANHWAYFTWLVPAAIVVTLAVFRRRAAWLAAAVGVYWAAVLPNLGLVPFDFQKYSTVADHYLYVAMLGPALASAFIACKIKKRCGAIAAILVVIALGSRSFAQTWTWRDTYALFRHAAEVNPKSCAAYSNLGDALRLAGRFDESSKTFEAGVINTPQCPELRLNYASLLVAMGKLDDAERQLKVAEGFAKGPMGDAVQIGLQRLQVLRQKQEFRKPIRPQSGVGMPATGR